jgi:hypothetical protein
VKDADAPVPVTCELNDQAASVSAETLRAAVETYAPTSLNRTVSPAAQPGDVLDLGGRHSDRWKDRVDGAIGHPIPHGDDRADGRGHDVDLRDFAVTLRVNGASFDEAVVLLNQRAQDCVPAWAGPDPIESRVQHWVGSAFAKFPSTCADDCKDVFCWLEHSPQRSVAMMDPFEAALLAPAPPDDDDDEFADARPHYIWLSDDSKDSRQRRRTYRPFDLWADHDGETVKPTILRRSDGACAFYRGEVNGLIGASESGKSMIALLACVQVIRDGGRVVYLDYERAPISFRDRLTSLWRLTDEERSRFLYLTPDQPFLDDQDRGDLESVVDNADLIVVDAWTAALSCYGLNSNSMDDTRLLSRKLLQPLASKGAAVLTLDHIRKDDGLTNMKGGIGSQDKRSSQHGAQLKTHVRKPLAKGKAGVVALYVDKDTNSALRSECEGDEDLWGLFRVEPDLITELPEVSLRAPAVRDPERTVGRIRESIADALAGEPELRPATWICKNVEGRQQTVRAELDAMVEEGILRSEYGSRNAKLYGLA